MREQPLSGSGYLIGQAAKLSGVSSANIRFYEAQGLLPKQRRTSASYRLYSKEDIHHLQFIRRLRSLDMTLDEVRSLLGLNLRNKRHCEQAQRVLTEHLGHVQARMKELRALEKNLLDLKARCDGAGEKCHLIAALHAQSEVDLKSEKSSTIRRHV